MKKIIATTGFVLAGLFLFAPAASAQTCYPPGSPSCSPTSGSGSVSTSSPAANGTITFSGDGFDPFSNVDIFGASTPRFLTSTTANGAGHFSVTIRVPSDWRPGETHELIARGIGFNGASRTVTAFVTIRGSLTPTGTNTVPIALIGLGVVVVGGTAVGIGRRKSHR